ncbi:hypothetical protein G7Y89_g12366 [Cudoniella acicularis]|uniref:Peptidase S53 domain-containing protein n=1 Tax=Cudoniella acicularis TaxID=354080 RepID=A0A8H4RBC9_9HELO|nr:hypothetical protein G7Y89_g12366 [Cudoniella acicularis]
MILPAFLQFLALAVSVRSAAVPSTHVVHEKRDGLTSHWEKREPVPANALLPMRIGLKQRNLELGHDLLMEISHPDSEKYAKHYTSEEVIELFAPHEDTVNAVRDWLIDFGIEPKRITHSDNKGWLAFDATAEDAENLLKTKYHLYEHAGTGHQNLGCESYHVPAHIQEHIDYITPGIKLLAPTKAKRDTNAKRGTLIQPSPLQPFKKVRPPTKPLPSDLATCDQFITPACIRALYNIPEIPEYPGGQPRTDNSLGIFEEGDFYNGGDLDQFFQTYETRIPVGTRPVSAFIDGAVSDGNGFGGESDLDFELAYPIVYPQNITLYQTDDSYWANNFVFGSSGLFNTFLDALDGSYCTYSAFGETGDDPNLDPKYPDPNGYNGTLQCGVYKPTNVISISYGFQESDLPYYYQQRFLKLGLQGVSVFLASGDNGVSGRPYLPPVGNGCLGDGTIFSPNFPNTCPYLTNVGATKVNKNQTVYDPETAVVDLEGGTWGNPFSSGGGFSNIYPTPDYQRDAVSQYLQNHAPDYPYYYGSQNIGKNGGIYNRLGRGFPDVAANGDNIAVIFDGFAQISGGTSASSPIFASIVNRINEARLNAGKRTVGFINPALYANPHVLNDITVGRNPGCDTYGFLCSQGWDPVTGLGTPNYPKMLNYFLELP